MKKRGMSVLLVILMLTVQTQFWATRVSASSNLYSLSYSFANSYAGFGYPPTFTMIPPARYGLMYGDNALAKQLYKWDVLHNHYTWRGNCYGMAATTVLFAGDNGISPSDFRKGAQAVSELSPSDINPLWDDMTLTEFIEAMQISQYSKAFETAWQQNKNRLDKLCELVSECESKGTIPPILCIYNGSDAGTAIVPYYMENGTAPDTRYKLHVYDPNFPAQDAVLTVSEALDSWSYSHYQGEEIISPWGSDDGGFLSFIPYEVCLSDWNERGHLTTREFVESSAISFNVYASTHGTEPTASIMRNGERISIDDIQAGDRVIISHIPNSGYAVSIQARDAYKNLIPVSVIDAESSWFSAPSAFPVTITLTYKIVNLNGEISRYSYMFDNSAKSFGYRAGYKIPLERFQLIYGQTALAKQKCEQAFNESQYWIGSCYGIGATAAMLAMSGNGVTAAAFRNGATRPGELQVSDVNAEWGLTLTQFIEAMQISQYSSMTAIASLQNKNRLSALISAASAFENGGGGPVLICVYGPDRNGNYAGHALLAYHLDGQQLYVYDSNYPNDGNRAITISDVNWSYAISDGVTWDNSNGEITYIPYETYLSDWINRGHVQGTTYVSLVANVADATVRDSAGNEVAAFQKGKMVKGAEKAYPFTHIGITADGVSTAPPQVAVWLPVDDVYTVKNQDASKTRCKVSLCNVNQGVSVETTSATVKLSAEDSTSMNFAAIEDIGCEYTITQMSGQDEVRFQGKTARDKVHALLENGVSSGSGITASTNISINGQTVSASDFMNGRTVSVSTISPRFTDVSPGQYFYDPVMWAVGREITNGTTATTFSPQNTCSRNHILTFLWRANGSPAAIGNPFTDVNPDTTFGKAALWAAEKGLVSGTRFNGDNPCTRAEAVTYLWKLAGRPAAGRSAFTDVPSNADYAQAVSWAVERGITKGTSDTTFEPSKICTRGQIVTFLYRTYVEN